MGAKVHGWSIYQSSLHKIYIPFTPFLQKKQISHGNLWSFRFVTLSFDIKVCSHLVFQLHQYGATHSLNPDIFHPRIFDCISKGILFFSLLTFGLKSQSTFYKVWIDLLQALKNIILLVKLSDEWINTAFT